MTDDTIVYDSKDKNEWQVVREVETIRGLRPEILRLEIPGGWLYKVASYTLGGGADVSVCFVPFPKDEK